MCMPFDPQAGRSRAPFVRRLAASLCALAAIGAVAPASATSAQASASASALTLTLTLVDLDPGDGVAPSITFQLPITQEEYALNGTQVTTLLGGSIYLPVPQLTLYDRDYYAPLALDVAGGNEVEHAAITGSGTSQVVGLSVASTAWDVGGQGAAHAALMGAWYGGTALDNFHLSAHTALEVTLWVAGSAQVDPRADGGGYQDARASSGLVLGTNRRGAVENFNVSLLSAEVGCGTVDVYGMPLCIGATDSYAGELRLSVSNDSNTIAYGYVGAFADAATRFDDPLPTVPEPATVLMLLLGAATLAARRARA